MILSNTSVCRVLQTSVRAIEPAWVAHVLWVHKAIVISKIITLLHLIRTGMMMLFTCCSPKILLFELKNNLLNTYSFALSFINVHFMDF